MLFAASKSPTTQFRDRERLARLLLAGTGVALALAPPVMVAGSGWPAIPLMTVMPLGVLLLVLSAFYPRINGEVRCGPFSVMIGPGLSPEFETHAAAGHDGQRAERFEPSEDASVPED